MSRMRRIGAGVLALAGSVAVSAANACPRVPAAIIDLDVERFYGDKAGTTVDPTRQATHDRAVAPLTAFLREITQNADKAVRRTAPKAQAEAAVCALSWLDNWARGGALLGAMKTQQSEYERKWNFTGLALAYVKLKPFASAAQRTAIEPWLVKLADASRAFFDNAGRTRNNHWYWLGLGLAAVGLDSPRHWEMARGIMRDAARDIAADGTLPLEMERQSRALFYHAFAITPLVAMADIAAARGEDWYAFADGALHRLVKRTHDGLVTPDMFDQLAGITQERPVNARAGWLQLYQARFPSRLSAPHPTVAEGHRWLGGNALALRDSVPRQP